MKKIYIAMALSLLVSACGEDNKNTKTSVQTTTTGIQPLSIKSIIQTPMSVIESAKRVAYRLNSPGWVAYGNGMYIAIDSPTNTTGAKTPRRKGDMIHVSNDGTSWKKVVENINVAITKLVHDGNWFYAAGTTTPSDANSATVIMRSKNGSSWETIYSDKTLGYVFDFKYNNGKFILVTASNVSLTSEDGLNWQKATISESNKISRFYTADYFNNEYVAAGDIDVFYTSANGNTWKNKAVFQPHGVRNIVNNGVSLLLQANDLLYVYNKDAATWQARKTSMVGKIGKISAQKGKFVLIEETDGTNGKMNYIYRSDDAIKWTRFAKLEAANDKVNCKTNNCIVHKGIMIAMP